MFGHNPEILQNERSIWNFLLFYLSFNHYIYICIYFHTKIGWSLSLENHQPFLLGGFLDSWIRPIFLSPGRQTWMIRERLQEDTSEYFGVFPGWWNYHHYHHHSPISQYLCIHKYIWQMISVNGSKKDLDGHFFVFFSVTNDPKSKSITDRSPGRSGVFFRMFIHHVWDEWNVIFQTNLRHSFLKN